MIAPRPFPKAGAAFLVPDSWFLVAWLHARNYRHLRRARLLDRDHGRRTAAGPGTCVRRPCRFLRRRRRHRAAHRGAGAGRGLHPGRGRAAGPARLRLRADVPSAPRGFASPAAGRGPVRLPDGATALPDAARGGLGRGLEEALRHRARGQNRCAAGLDRVRSTAGRDRRQSRPRYGVRHRPAPDNAHVPAGGPGSAPSRRRGPRSRHGVGHTGRRSR